MNPASATGTELKAIAFDLGDTLVEYHGVPLNWEAHYPDALRALAGSLGVTVNAEHIERASAVLRRYNTRIHPREPEVAFSAILRELLQSFGYDGEAEETAGALAFFSVFRQQLRCFPETMATLASLRRRGLTIGLFTDVPYGMPRDLVLADLRETGLAGAVDVVLTSRDVGFRKPAVATLAALARELGCEPGELAYVGNERKDVAAATAFGCPSILIDRARQGVEWGQTRTIASLSELQDRI